VCSFLLHLLNTNKETNFVISDEHTNFTPCAIPDSLPGDIVFMMVVEFSRILREELSKLMNTSTRELRGRSGTSDTARMSFESDRSSGHQRPKKAHVSKALQVQNDSLLDSDSESDSE
jgi:hypothetical protein